MNRSWTMPLLMGALTLGVISADLLLMKKAQAHGSEHHDGPVVIGDHVWANQADFIASGRKCKTPNPTRVQMKRIEAVHLLSFQVPSSRSSPQSSSPSLLGSLLDHLR